MKAIHKSLLISSLFLLSAFISCSEDGFVPDDGLDYTHIDKAFIYPLYSTAKHIREVNPKAKSDFIFLTDTHYSDNSLHSPSLLHFLVQNGYADRVFWGGDAVSAYGNIEYEWREHQEHFLQAVTPFGSYYQIRGNHEFTSMDPATKRGITYDAPHTAQRLLSHTEYDVIRPADDPTACYYYVDDAEQHLRYCIFDTTDSIASTTAPWATVVHTSQQQLDWMEANALHGVPAGYDLIIMTHIGIIPETYHLQEPLEPLHQLLLHAEAPVLMVLSGHMHQDFQTYDNGILHVLTGSDANYPEYANSPYLHSYQRSANKVSSQLLDCFSISPDHRTIQALRLGAGFSRTFHLDTLRLSLSKSATLTMQSKCIPVNQLSEWYSYDASGYQCIDEPWQPTNEIVAINSKGVVRPLRPGHAVIMAVDNSGNKEFFPITIVQ